jgi:EAL domain-containing protein (putative c-di-GMP-specific phosphodiesterase class I)
MADPRLVEMLTATARRITVEVTEHVGIADYDDFARTIALLRTTGARIAVDDAGAGVASLRHIVHIAPNIIKLDISLTQGVSGSPLRLALATSLIEFAQQTGAQLLVEGVEDVADLRAWSQLGAHGVQGFLVGRPSLLPVPVTSLRIAEHAAAELRAGRQHTVRTP